MATEPNRVRVSVGLPVTLPFGARPLLFEAVAVAAREPGPPPTPTGQPSPPIDEPRFPGR